MLMLLTQSVNFTNILQQFFCTKVFCEPFMYLQFVFVIFWQKKIGLKYHVNEIVKLTQGLLKLLNYKRSLNKGLQIKKNFTEQQTSNDFMTSSHNFILTINLSYSVTMFQLCPTIGKPLYLISCCMTRSFNKHFNWCSNEI